MMAPKFSVKYVCNNTSIYQIKRQRSIKLGRKIITNLSLFNFECITCRKYESIKNI